MTGPMDKIEVTQADIEPDMSWFMFAVRKGGRDVVILNYAQGWEPHNIEFHWEDTFQSDPPSHLEPGCYLWTGFRIGFWGEDDHINVTGGSFTRFERDILATRTDATPDHVAALVEAAKAFAEIDLTGSVLPLDFAMNVLTIRVALAPFTKGQNDE